MPALSFGRDDRSEHRPPRNLPPAEREIFQIAFHFQAHAQADEDDDEKIEQENADIDDKLPVHALLGDRISTARKVDRALRRAMLNNSGLASRISH